MEEFKHNSSDLAQMQSLPLEAKIRMTKQRIRSWYEYWDGQVYISFSGGKDSTVLKHIVDSMYSDVPAVFVNTGLEFPEIQLFVKAIRDGEYDCFNPDVEIIRPEMRFDEVIKEYGYPVISKEVAQKIWEGRRAIARGNEDNYAVRQFNGTYVSKSGKKNQYSVVKWKPLFDSDIPVSHMCCKIMKKNPAKKYEHDSGRKPFLGTLAAESMLRKQKWLQHGCNAFEKERPTSQPLSFWTEQDILEYLLKYNVPYASVYGSIKEEGELDGQMFIDGFHSKLCTTGVDRTGCMFCMFGIQMDRLGRCGDKNRFQIMKDDHPNQYNYCMKPVEDGGLGIKRVLEFLNIPWE